METEAMIQFVADDVRRPSIRIFGVRSGIGGRDPGAVAAADTLKAAGLEAHLAAGHGIAEWGGILEPARRLVVDPTAAMARLNPRIAAAVRDACVEGARPFVIGGDHSCAVGTWSGVHGALGAGRDLGLLWIDAHLDSHTPQTSHTGLIYGMPLAVLLGHGDPVFTGCLNAGPKVLPHHVCVFGARSYEPEERALLDRIGVRVIGMAEIARRGVADAMREALGIVSRASGGFGITIDMDALDPRDAPGVGTPAPGGLRAAELIGELERVGGSTRLRALEICEYNPARDRRGVTQRNLVGLARAVLGAGADARLLDAARVA
jgi:arginase